MEVVSLTRETSSLLRGMDIAVLMADGAEEIEYTHPRSFLERHGATVVTVAPKPASEWVQTYRAAQPAGKYPVDLEVHDARPADFDALLIPGGLSSPVKLYLTATATDFIRSFGELNRTIGAICHAPATLIVAGLLEGRRVTSWPTLRDALEQAGAVWLDAEVVIDGQLITARGPNDLVKFEEALLQVLAPANRHGNRPRTA